MKRVVVTGASTGIGRATALLLAERGWRVFPTVRSAADAADLRERGLEPLCFDVTDAAEVEAALAGLEVDALINNAGISLCAPVLQTSPEELARVLDVNLIGVHRMVKALGPGLIERGGRIVNISSTAGRTAWPFFGAYSASKHALDGYSQVLRRELAPLGVAVSVVAPGMVATPIQHKVAVQERDRDGPWGPALKALEAHLATEPQLQPEQVAEKVLEALTAPNPKPHYRIAPRPLKARALEALPDAWLDRLFQRFFKDDSEPSR